MHNKGMRNGNVNVNEMESRGMEGLVYPSRGNRVPIPNNLISNPNTITSHGIKVPIPVNPAH